MAQLNSADDSAKDWELYEEQIFRKLRTDFPDSAITKNDHIKGQFSKVSRQVDISIRGDLTGYEVLGVVECKHFSRRVDVKVVDSFIGFLEDVKANLGVIITNEGFSTAARNRASVRDIRLEIVEFEHLGDYDLSWYRCGVCDPGPERFPALVSFGPPDGVFCGDEPVYIIRVGHCDWCNSVHIECQACGVVTPIWPGDYDRLVECEGGCGLHFRVTQGPKDDPEDRIEVLVR